MLLYQPKFHSLSGGAGFRDAEFRFFTLATIFCLGAWFWLSLGKWQWGKEHRSFVIAWSILAIASLGFIREVHPQSWDFMCYYLAGRGMAAGVNIYDPAAVTMFNAGYDSGITYYTYTPLLAAILGQLEPLSREQVFTLFSFLNYFALLLCGASLYLALLRYRSPRSASALVMLIALLINVPVTRTLLNSQVNLWVLTFMLLTVLFYRSVPFLSALSLALAANFKVTPILIVGLFVLKRDWKWLSFFAFSQLLIVTCTALTCAFDYWMYFASFALRSSVIVDPTHMRNSSFDALVAHTLYILDIKLPVLQEWLVVVIKMGFVLWVSKLIWDVVRQGTFVTRDDKDALLLNGFPLFLVVMAMAPPLVWPHHFVFLLLPLLVTLKVAREKWTFKLLLLIYGSLFLVPVFDVYPLSLHRLVSMVLYAYSVSLILKEDTAKPTAMERLTGLLRSSKALSSR
ncbi:MAG: DUF2029 domain-containing protein [Chloroflexi bacterium]|nr:DUF2029 domain-containing protein [Chloroflexota bacterium]